MLVTWMITWPISCWMKQRSRSCSASHLCLQSDCVCSDNCSKTDDSRTAWLTVQFGSSQQSKLKSAWFKSTKHSCPTFSYLSCYLMKTIFFLQISCLTWTNGSTNIKITLHVFDVYFHISAHLCLHDLSTCVYGWKWHALRKLQQIYSIISCNSTRL